MLDILGSNFDREGPKSDEFSRLVMALRVQSVLSGYADGLLKVSNTEKCVKETTELLDQALAACTLDKKSALTLRGIRLGHLFDRWKADSDWRTGDLGSFHVTHGLVPVAEIGAAYGLY